MMKLLIALALLQSAAAASNHAHLESVMAPKGFKDGSSVFTATNEVKILREHGVHARRSDIKKGLRANGDVNHEVIFSVKQNLEELKTLVDDISNPFSANYGKHLKRDEVTSMTAVPESFQHVSAFLKLHGIKIVKTSKFSEYITASAPVSKWEELFATEFHSYQLDSFSTPVIRADHYSLPETLDNHVSAVFNTVQFPLPKIARSHYVKMDKKVVKDEVVDLIVEGAVTPALLNEVYDIRSNAGSAATSQGVYEAQMDGYSPSDLALFQETFNLPADEVIAVGGYSDDNACANLPDCGESNLDVQYMTAVAQGVPTYYLYDDSGDFLLSWATSIAEMEDPPKVLSISWGGPEGDFTPSYIEEFNTQAMKLASMGVTIVTSSGDDGVANYVVRSNPRMCSYQPDYPAASVYVTVVGGTMGPESDDDEVACQSDKGGVITTGGGFSTNYGVPSWQTEAVASYFANAAADETTPVAGYNAGGRGYPDVSLLARNYLVMMGGEFGGLYGTSASSPAFGAMVSLVNSRRLEAGKSTLGWLNPSLYALADSFINDITKGSNNCGVGGKTCCAQGFTATSGWDPVTGLGSVNYTSFEAAFMALGDNPDVPTVKPTLAPNHALVLSKAPTFRPTRLPTVAPTIASGWLYTNFYEEPECEGSINRVEGWRTGVCLSAQSSSFFEDEEIFFQYYCDANNGYIAAYSDSECQNQLGARVIGLDECSVSNHYYYYGEEEFSVSVSCTTTPLSSKPLDTSTSYVVQRYFNTMDGCNAADEYKFEAIRNKYCFSRPEDDSSFKFRYPDVFQYANSSTCSSGELSESSSSTIETGCQTDVGADGVYYYFGSVVNSVKVQFVESTTTRSPTPKATATPTFASNNYLMTVEQTIHGISAETFNSDLEVNTEAFTATIADCMEGIESEDITINSVTDVTVASRLRLLTASNVHIDYTVRYDITALGFPNDAEGAYESLLEDLNEAIAGTHFRKFLAANIELYNATSLEDARTGEVVSSSYADQVDDDIPKETHYHEKPDTRNVIIGCVVGVAGFFIVGVFYALYHMNQHNAATEAIKKSGPSSVVAARTDGFEAVRTKETELVPTSNTPEVMVAPVQPDAEAAVAPAAAVTEGEVAPAAASA